MLHSIMQHKGECEPRKTPFVNGITTARGIATRDVLSNLFNPEVFFDPIRSKKYIEWMSIKDTRISWLVYDFMPFLYPEHYAVGTPLHCMPYLLAMRNIPRLAFISSQTRREFDTKIVRNSNKATIVLPLGGDGLKFEKQCFFQERRSFIYFGTIEPRKNVGAILRAFMTLWKRGDDIELFVVGRIDARAREEQGLINQLQNEPRFHYLGHASDAILCEVLRKVRAAIFVSSEEGFGIPPLESLAAGIPVIASGTLPSLNDLPYSGYLEIENISPATICTAIEFLSADANAAKLWQEARNLPIPTWRDFVSGISSWLRAP
jgi:glycosyltransferase involved in cell wall biosynthesis